MRYPELELAVTNALDNYKASPRIPEGILKLQKELIKSMAVNSAAGAIVFKDVDKNLTPSEQLKLSDEMRIKRALFITTEALNDLTAAFGVDQYLDSGRRYLIDEIALQRQSDAPALSDLTTGQAYDLGMRGAFMVLDKGNATVEYTLPSDHTVTLHGGLVKLFDVINN